MSNYDDIRFLKGSEALWRRLYRQLAEEKEILIDYDGREITVAGYGIAAWLNTVIDICLESRQDCLFEWRLERECFLISYAVKIEDGDVSMLKPFLDSDDVERSSIEYALTADQRIVEIEYIGRLEPNSKILSPPKGNDGLAVFAIHG